MRARHLAGSPGVEDRGWRFGMSVFETWAVYEGRTLFFEAHARRLERAAGGLLGAEAGALAARVARAALEPEVRSGVVRIYVSAGPGDLCSPAERPAAWLLEEECGVSAGPGPGEVVTASPEVFTPAPGGWKTGNYWSHLRALAIARGRGAREALLFNAGGLLVGCACANVFLRVDGCWVTPGRDCGARDGVVREWVLGRLEAREAGVTREVVARAEEMFFTNSRAGIVAVAAVDGRNLGSCETAARFAGRYAAEILHG